MMKIFVTITVACTGILAFPGIAGCDLKSEQKSKATRDAIPLYAYTPCGFVVPGCTNDLRFGYYGLGDRIDTNDIGEKIVTENKVFGEHSFSEGLQARNYGWEYGHFKDRFESVNVCSRDGFIKQLIMETKGYQDEVDALDDLMAEKEWISKNRGFHFCDDVETKKKMGKQCIACFSDAELGKKTGVVVAIYALKYEDKYYVNFAMVLNDRLLQKSLECVQKGGEFFSGIQSLRLAGWSLFQASPAVTGKHEFSVPYLGRFTEYSLSFTEKCGVMCISMLAQVPHPDGCKFNGRQYGTWDEADADRREFIRQEIRTVRKELQEKWGMRFYKKNDPCHLTYSALLNEKRFPGVYLTITDDVRDAAYSLKLDAEQLTSNADDKNEILKRIQKHREWVSAFDKAKKGDAESMCDLALWYEQAYVPWYTPGEVVTPYYYFKSDSYEDTDMKARNKLATEWLDKAIAAGSVRALIHKGDLCIDNNDVAVKEQGVECYKRAKGQDGQALAEYKIGLWYRQNYSGYHGEKEAYPWFKRAAQHGHPEAQTIVAARDKEEAAAAERDVPDVTCVKPSEFCKGSKYKVSFYKVRQVLDGYIVATYDYGQEMKAKQLASLFLGQGFVRASELAECFKSDILILTKRELADGDALPEMLVKYVGITKLKNGGGIRTFKEWDGKSGSSTGVSNSSVRMVTKDEPRNKGMSGDPRVESVLTAAKVKFRVDSDGDFRVSWTIPTNRSHMTFIDSKTYRINSAEVRDVWAYGYMGRELPQEQLDEILKEKGKNKIGSWRVRKRTDGSIVLVFFMPAPADTDGGMLKFLSLTAAEEGDRMEKRLMGSDKL